MVSWVNFRSPAPSSTALRRVASGAPRGSTLAFLTKKFEITPSRTLYTRSVSETGVPLTTDVAIERGKTWLAKSDLRPTRQRVSLAALLIGDGENRHVTAESLFSAAKAQGEKVSLATVYNTLKAFCDAGLMQEVSVDGSRSYFDTNTHEHPHFFWEDDGRLTDAAAEKMKIVNLPEAPEGSEIASVEVVIRLRKI